MYNTLSIIKTKVYDLCSFHLCDIITEPESKEYHACRYKLDGNTIFYRNAKITPKKVGQFVTFWRRNSEGITEPYKEQDSVDYYVINVESENNLGQFVFPKSTLIKKGIISTDKKDGKRGFRVYPAWDDTTNKQAKTTQKWQLDYFYLINESTNLEFVKELYRAK